MSDLGENIAPLLSEWKIANEKKRLELNAKAAELALTYAKTLQKLRLFKARYSYCEEEDYSYGAAQFAIQFAAGKIDPDKDPAALIRTIIHNHLMDKGRRIGRHHTVSLTDDSAAAFTKRYAGSDPYLLDVENEEIHGKRERFLNAVIDEIPDNAAKLKAMARIIFIDIPEEGHIAAAQQNPILKTSPLASLHGLATRARQAVIRRLKEWSVGMRDDGQILLADEVDDFVRDLSAAFSRPTAHTSK